MSTTGHQIHLLHDYLDGTLAADEQQTVAQHLAACPACRDEYERLRTLLADMKTLPRTVEPPRDLWDEIKARIDTRPAQQASTTLAFGVNRAEDRAAHDSSAASSRRLRSTRWVWGSTAVVLLLIGLGTAWLVRSLSGPAWTVASLEGSPWVDDASLPEKGTLRVGQWLETDASSRALLDVGLIGQVELAPETRLQLRKAHVTDHRLVLAEGRIEARIWAPPRLFFVETPSALAIDLGCIYTLSVDSTGTSLLHVTSGYVELEYPGRASSLVPAGAMCLARPGQGPGTAFDQEASQALRQALVRYDFEGGGAAALTDILADARATDAITLWQLLLQADAQERSRIYDRLVELVTPPAGVTREGVLRHEAPMIDAWQRHLDLEVWGWAGTKKKRKALQEAE